MALKLRKKHYKLLGIIIISIVIILLLESLISPIYTRRLFEPLAKESLFPEYTNTVSDVERIKQMYGDYFKDSYAKHDFITIHLSLDSSVYTSIGIYGTDSECDEIFWSWVGAEPDGMFLEDTDEFKVFITKKSFNDLLYKTVQTLYVKNGNTFYNITKCDFVFSQKDFKDSILLLEELKQSGGGSMIEPEKP